MEMRHAFGDNVVGFRPRGAAMTFPAVAQVDAYWEGLRAGRQMPERAEVDPRGLDSALEYALMLERVAPGVARVRVAGMHLADLLGMEVRGMPLSAFVEPEDRDRLARIVERVVRTPEVADLRLSSPRGIGRPPLEARLYLAPLADPGRRHARILTCLQSAGRIGRAPRRFAIDRVQMRRIVAVAGDAPEVSARPAPQPAFAEPAADYAPAPAGKAPHLRLVKSDG